MDFLNTWLLTILIFLPTAGAVLVMFARDRDAIRRTALVHRVPYTTTMSAASAACDAIIALKSRTGSVRSLQEWHEKTTAENRVPAPANAPPPRGPRAVRA